MGQKKRKARDLKALKEKGLEKVTNGFSIQNNLKHMD